MLSDIAIILTAIGVLSATFGLRQSYRQRLRQFEELYVQRYWAILDRLSVTALSGRDPVGPVVEGDDQAIRAYIRLSEDELEMRHKGWVGDSTYEIWRDGIRVQLRQPTFGQVWEAVCREPASPYFLKELMKPENKEYDPCEFGPVRRRLRGLAGRGGV